MKHSEIIKAYTAINRISGDDMPIAVSYKLFKVKKMLEPQWDFQSEKFNAVIKKYNPMMLPDGSIKFRSKNEGKKCADELNAVATELDNMDVEFAEIRKPIIKLDTDIKLSIGDIEALEEFIDFQE